MLTRIEIGALLLRIMLGIVFLINGVVKFQDGIENTVGRFESIGINGSLAYVVAIVEIVCGIAMILGIGTRIAAFLFCIIMLGAIFTVKWSDGFLNVYIYDLVLLIISIHIILNGSKLYSLGQLLFKTREV